MIVKNTYLVAPLTNLRSGSSITCRTLTVHETHAEAVAECSQRAQDQRSNQKFVVYRAITLVGRTERPIEVCAIEDDGSVTC